MHAGRVLPRRHSTARWPTCAAHVATGGTAVLVLAGAGTAQRAVERLREADVPAALADDGLTEPRRSRAWSP